MSVAIRSDNRCWRRAKRTKPGAPGWSEFVARRSAKARVRAKTRIRQEVAAQAKRQVEERVRAERKSEDRNRRSRPAPARRVCAARAPRPRQAASRSFERAAQEPPDRGEDPDPDPARGDLLVAVDHVRAHDDRTLVAALVRLARAHLAAQPAGQVIGTCRGGDS